MSANDGEQLSTEEAAAVLREARNVGERALREFFETGGGLLGIDESELVAAVDVVGRQRAADILSIEIPQELPGEQMTLGGEPEPGRVPEERPEPTPRGVASLSEFSREERSTEVKDIIVSRIAGRLRYNVPGAPQLVKDAVPVRVEDERGPPDQFAINDVVGTVTFDRNGAIVSLDVEPSVAGDGAGEEPIGVDRFTLTDTEGEVVLEFELGDAVEVTFFNTFSKELDTTQGVIERIRSAPEADETLIFLSNDVTFRPVRGGAVRIEDRQRGHLPRDQPVQKSIRKLFDAGDGAGAG